MAKFRVNIEFTTMASYDIEADNEDDAEDMAIAIADINDVEGPISYDTFCVETLDENDNVVLTSYR